MSSRKSTDVRIVLESLAPKVRSTVQPQMLEVPASTIEPPVLDTAPQDQPPVKQVQDPLPMAAPVTTQPRPFAKAAPVQPKNSYLSKVFKEGIKPEMFNRPDSMSEGALAELCARFNFVVKQGGDLRETILKTLGLNTGTTGRYDVSKLAQDTDRFWAELHRLEDEEERRSDPSHQDTPLPAIPSVQAILKTEIGWESGSSVDSIKEHRPADIGTAKVDKDKPKQALVKAAALAQANEQLERAGSFIRLEVASRPDQDGFVKIRPVFKVDKQITATHAESHHKLVGLNKARQDQLGASQEATEDKQYVSWADCHRTAQTIMGSEDSSSGIADQERVVMKGLDTLVEPIPKSRISELPGASDHGANRAMHGFFAAAMPKLHARLEKKQKEGAELTKVEKEALQLISAQMSNPSDAPRNFRSVYAKLCGDKAIAKEFAQEFGVNEAIVPKVGTAFAQINDEGEKAAAKKEGKDLWNFHFAGVVLVNPDGSYMTLENLSVEDSNAVNDDWYFAVYDPKNGKSFHEVNAKDSHVGKSPITLLFDKAPA
jgi:hypothetical protein